MVQYKYSVFVNLTKFRGCRCLSAVSVVSTPRISDAYDSVKPMLILSSPLNPKTQMQRIVADTKITQPFKYQLKSVGGGKLKT